MTRARDLLRRLEALVEKAEAEAEVEDLSHLSDEELRARVDAFRKALHEGRPIPSFDGAEQEEERVSLLPYLSKLSDEELLERVEEGRRWMEERGIPWWNIARRLSGLPPVPPPNPAPESDIPAPTGRSGASPGSGAGADEIAP